MIYRKKEEKNQGAIALLLVIIISALTIVSSITIALLNVSDVQQSYQSSEAEIVQANINACLDELIFQLSLDVYSSGYFSLIDLGTSCAYEIDEGIVDGIKTATISASSTSDLGFWQKEVIVLVNVSSTPISVYSYKNDPSAFASATPASYCGDGVLDEETEECDGSADPTGLAGWSCSLGGTLSCNESCQRACSTGEDYQGSCGDSTTQAPEVCDPPQSAGSCGDGVVQNGDFCNSTCSGYVSRSESCDYTGPQYSPGCYTSPVGCGKLIYCANNCSSCTNACL